MQILHFYIGNIVQIRYNTKKKGDDIISTLKELRIAKGLTQEDARSLLGLSLRSYKSYENDESKIGTLHVPFLSYCYCKDIHNREFKEKRSTMGKKNKRMSVTQRLFNEGKDFFKKYENDVTGKCY